jgi:hypothetical protein
LSNTPLRSLKFWPIDAVDRLDNNLVLVHTAEQVIYISRRLSGNRAVAAVTGLPPWVVALLVSLSEQVLGGALSQDAARNMVEHAGALAVALPAARLEQ